MRFDQNRDNRSGVSFRPWNKFTDYKTVEAIDKESGNPYWSEKDFKSAQDSDIIKLILVEKGFTGDIPVGYIVYGHDDAEGITVRRYGISSKALGGEKIDFEDVRYDITSYLQEELPDGLSLILPDGLKPKTAERKPPFTELPLIDRLKVIQAKLVWLTGAGWELLQTPQTGEGVPVPVTPREVELQRIQGKDVDISRFFFRTMGPVPGQKKALNALKEFVGQRGKPLSAGDAAVSGPVIIPAGWFRPTHMTLGKPREFEKLFSESTPDLPDEDKQISTRR